MIEKSISSQSILYLSSPPELFPARSSAALARAVCSRPAMTTATTSAEPNAEAVVVMQGYLKKKSPKALGKGKVVDVWQKRYFVLTGAQLKYYKDKHGAETSTSSSREPLKMIAMAQVHSAAPNPKHLDMLTIDLGAERKVKLQASSEEDRDAWVAAIEQSKVEAWSRQEAQEATREQAPTADATLQIASPQRVRLEEEVSACTCLPPACTCLPTLPHLTPPYHPPSGGALQGGDGGLHLLWLYLLWLYLLWRYLLWRPP